MPDKKGGKTPLFRGGSVGGACLAPGTTMKKRANLLIIKFAAAGSGLFTGRIDPYLNLCAQYMEKTGRIK